MKFRFWKKGAIPGEGLPAREATATVLGAISGRRAFLKNFAVALAGVGAGQLASEVTTAEAAYTSTSGMDTVDTNLTVQGNLVVNRDGQQCMAIGTDAIQGKLNVAGDVWMNDVQAIGTDGVVKVAYYAP